MNQNGTTAGTIGSLLVLAIIITIVYSYLPADLSLARQVLSWVQLACMGLIVAVTVRSVLKDF